jgi:uncharacterized membrane protein YdbT with pleckstrin-like domain
MSYITKVLQPEEQIVAFGRKHWILYLPGILLLILAVLVFVIGPQLYHQMLAWEIIAGIIGAIALVALFRAWFQQWTTEIAVTNRRVLVKTGFISRRTAEMNMEKVESVLVDQNLWGRIFGYGTVQVRGTGAGMDSLDLIANPLMLRNAIVVR